MALVKDTDNVKGKAQILAIGTANPPNCFHQADYLDYYFHVTKSDHLIDLKAKFKRICEKSMIEKRYMHVNEEILEQNPTMIDHGGEIMVSSLNIRMDMEIMEIPKLGAEAANKAMDEWGQPKSRITHLVFHSTLGTAMPGADYQLIKLLGLNPSVKRYMLYHLGCYGGGTALRLAKDLAENNPGSRVLVVCCEITSTALHGPASLQYTHFDFLVAHAIFGDGAGAVIVGCIDPPNHNVVSEHHIKCYEQPLFEIYSAHQTFLPNSEDAVGGRLREAGLMFYLSKWLPDLISSNIVECCLVEALGATINDNNNDNPADWNSLFWLVHPAGRLILDNIETKLELNEEKLRASRNVLRDYGNMLSSSVFFVLDEMRKGSIAQQKTTTGEGFEWGVLLGFGPGVTLETVVLRSVPTSK